MLWRQAKKARDFEVVAPSFGGLINLYREYATKLSDYYNIGKYESLLYNYNYGCSVVFIDKMFRKIKDTALTLRAKVLTKQKSKHKDTYDRIRKIKLNNKQHFIRGVIKAIGFDLTKGCIGYSDHPCSTGCYDDVRIVLQKNDHFVSLVESFVHETGHALYLQNLPPNNKHNLLGDFAGYLIHESQALIWEFCIGKSKEFSEFLAKKIYEISAIEIGEHDYFIAVNYINAGSVRIDSDELSYILHIIMRYEVEKKLIEGDIEVTDIPQVWKTLSKEYNISNDYGCVEDIHWYAGYIGYFPFYLLGAMYASQFYNKIITQNNNINISEGKFGEIATFLKNHIHNKVTYTIHLI